MPHNFLRLVTALRSFDKHMLWPPRYLQDFSSDYQEILANSTLLFKNFSDQKFEIPPLCGNLSHCKIGLLNFLQNVVAMGVKLLYVKSTSTCNSSFQVISLREWNKLTANQIQCRCRVLLAHLIPTSQSDPLSNSFNLRSLYFQYLQCLPNLILLHTLGSSPMCTSFQWINDKN